MIVSTAVVINSIVVSIIALFVILAVIHLIKVYKKSPCGDCSEAKHCKAFSKEKIFKEYKKACKREN